MSEFDDSWPSQPPQDFSGVGIDIDVARMIKGDIDPTNPDRYQNAGIWAGLIVEATTEVARSTELGRPDQWEVRGYLHEALVAPIEEEYGSTRAVRDFSEAMCNNTLSEHATYHFPEGGFGTFNTWQYRPEVIADYTARKMEYDDLGDVAVEHIDSYTEGALGFSVDELQAHAEQLQDILRRRKEIEGDPDRGSGIFSAARSRSRSYDSRPNVGYGLVKTTNQEIARISDLAAEKAQFAQVLEEATDGLELDESLRQTMGAKGANLTHVNQVLSVLKEGDVPVAEYLNIPRFTVLTTEVYDKWIGGEKIADDIKKIAAWMAENPGAHYIARSSAVNSEDGEHMGAGVYDSVLIPPGANLSGIYKAIRVVYNSVNSDKAKEYRASIGVEEEKMSVIVQELSDDDLSDTRLISVNTVMANVPQLADYVVEDGPHPLFEGTTDRTLRRHPLPLDRSGMFIEFGTTLYDNAVDSPRYHVPPDTRYHSARETWLATQASMLAEKAMGGPVQVELVVPYSNMGVDIVQARLLPPEWQQPAEFDGFPNDEPWYEGRGVGVFNGVEATLVPYLHEFELERHREGLLLVQWRSSYGMGASSEDLLRNLRSMSPEQRKRFVCLIQQEPTRDSVSNYGHLETLFTEMGVGLVFYDSSSINTRGFAADQNVKVYSNGYKAKLYADESDPAYQAYISGDNTGYENLTDIFDDEPPEEGQDNE